MTRHKRVASEDMIMKARIESLNILTDLIPDHIRNKILKFGSCGDKLHVVTDISSNQLVSPPELQQIFCISLGVCPAIPMSIITQLALGRIPDDMIIIEDAERLLWFALNSDNQVVIVDVTKWDALPGVKFCDFPCSKYAFQNRAQEMTKALQDLGDAVDVVSSHMSSSELKDIMDSIKKVYDLSSTV